MILHLIAEALYQVVEIPQAIKLYVIVLQFFVRVEISVRQALDVDLVELLLVVVLIHLLGSFSVVLQTGVGLGENEESIHLGCVQGVVGTSDETGMRFQTGQLQLLM